MVHLRTNSSLVEGLLNVCPYHLWDESLRDAMAGRGPASDLMQTSSVEGSIDEDYLISNREPMFGNPGREALLLGRMQSLKCDGGNQARAPGHAPDLPFNSFSSEPQVFSGVPLGLSAPVMVMDSRNFCSQFPSPFEGPICPDVKTEDDFDDQLLNSITRSMSMNMSIGLSFSGKLSGLEDFNPVPPEFPASFPSMSLPDPQFSCLMPMLRTEQNLPPVKPKLEEELLTVFPGPASPPTPDFALGTVANVTGSPPTTPEVSSIGHGSESDLLDYDYSVSPPPPEPKETRKSGRTRRDVGAKSTNVPRGGGRSKGVTMCLRTLLRQLLAGTGWIMDSSMSKDHATRLIRELIGPDLDEKCHIQLTPDQAEGMSSEEKENHYSRLLADLVTVYLGKTVSYERSQQLIKRDKGPYHLTQQFIDLLEDRPWPPRMIPERQLRSFGCYRQGEASKRGKLMSNLLEQ